MIIERMSNRNLTVAKMCKMIASEYGCGKKTCDMFFFMGYVHDLVENGGKDFSSFSDLFKEFGKTNLSLLGGDIIYALENQGNPYANQTLALKVLNLANLQVNTLGDIVSINDRLKEIKKKYGAKSEEYEKAVLLSQVVRNFPIKEEKGIRNDDYEKEM